jgi:hypothetical protein
VIDVASTRNASCGRRRIARPSVALAGLAALVAALCVAPPAAPVDFTDPARVALETDRIIDRMSVPPTATNLAHWTREILPWFAAEGIVRVERAAERVRYADFTGSEAILVLGAADCRAGEVSISRRYVNPVSSAYRSVDMVLTLAHELAHVQQGPLCERAPTALVETSAQLMALEVMAAMALDGNSWAGLALLRELRDMAVGMLAYDAGRGIPGAREELESVSGAIYTSAERARAAQRKGVLARRPLLAEDAALSYAVAPYRKLAAAFRGDLIVTGLATPITHSRPWASRPTDGTLEVGDLARFLDLATELYEGSESPGRRQSVADG